MRFSMMTEPQMGGTYDQILQAARFAESAGLYSFARSDHLAWNSDPVPAATDALATLAGLARDTTSIRLCVLVTPITFRHPAIIAKNAATISEMSGGRFDLGVGTGWNEFEHEALGLPFPDSTERWERFEEALGYLQTAFAPGHGQYQGRHYSLDLEVNPKPRGVRLIIGGGGERRTPRLAGARADEYNFFVCPPEKAAKRIRVMRESAGDREVEVTVMGPAFVAKTDQRLQARVNSIAKRRGIGEEELISRWDAAGAIYGTTNQAQEKIAALEEAGVDRIYLQWLDLEDQHGLVEMVETVLG